MFTKVGILTVAMILVFCSSVFSQNIALKDHKDTLSYSIGYNIGNNVKSNVLRDSLNISYDVLIAGLRDALTKASGLISQDVIQKEMTNLSQELMAKQQAKQKEDEAKMKVVAEGNKVKGAKFLDDNKKKEGVKTTPSGLQYKVVKEGTGKKPKETSTVKVHYTGTTIEGKKFDSSVDRGQPAEFPLNGVIKGWTEGLQLMTVGSKYMFYIPSELAYGDRQMGQDIQPGSVLIFEVELLDIVKE